MNLNGNAPGAGSGRLLIKISLVMRLTAVLLLVGCLQVSANSIAQTITISEKNAPLDKVFKQIEKQTSYVFFYDDHILQNAKKVDVNMKNASIEQVLQVCLKDTPLNYQIVGNTIIVVLKQKSKGIVDAVQGGDKGAAFIDVRGRVTNENGEAIAGVTVSVRGTKQATFTNVQGEFFLTNTDKNAVLVFTGSNVETFEVKVAGQAEVMVKLTTKVNKLDEVQVIAYGTTTQRLSTGNVTTVKGEDIQKQPISNLLSALEGRVPGLVITQNTGVPGGGITVRIQGQNSLLNGNDPLYVIDGVPFLSQLPSLGLGGILGSSGGQAIFQAASSTGSNPLNLINPSDIESVEILKDADATAIYGSRAANGAILITTKKGKVGQSKIDINLQQGWARVGHKLDLLNTTQYLQMRNEALRNDLLIPSANPAATSPYKYAPDLMLWDTTRYTDWQKALIGGTAQYTNINTSISGGTSAIQYFVGGTYHRETTVFPGDFSDQKASVHFSINTTSANQKFRAQFLGNYLIDNNQLPQTDLTSNAVLFEPDAPALYNSNGTLNWAPNSAGTSSFNNPIAALRKTYQNKSNNLVSNAILSFKILPGLEIKSSFGYTNIQSNETNAVPLTTIKPESQTTTSRSAIYGYRSLSSWSIEPQISYQRRISDGKLDVLIGSTILKSNNNGQQINATGFTSDLLLKDVNSAASINNGGTFFTQYRYNAIFGRLNYNWRDKYILNITARRDGSSRFGPESQFHNFGSAGAAWIFSQERLIKKNLTFLTFGKLKASYGTTGNDQIGDYTFLNLYNPTPNIGVPYQGLATIYPGGLSNPYLAWEETRKLYIGMDLGFFKDRILINAAYERNRSSNELLRYSLPNITGNSSIALNFPATIQNTSWEFSINTVNVQSGSVSWSTNINLSIPQNKLISFPNLSASTYATSLIIGQPITIQKAYQFVGVDPATGLYTYRDSHGNPTTSPNFSIDRTVLINTMPKFYGGIQNSFGYKGFKLDVLFQFIKQVAGNSFMQYTQQFPGIYFTGSANQSTTILDRWQKPGDFSTVQRYSTVSGSTGLVKASTAGYDDASFVRVKNISLSWQLPDAWNKKAHMQNCRVYVQGQNLLTFTKYTGLDPETQSISSLPPLMVMTFGIQIGL